MRNVQVHSSIYRTALGIVVVACAAIGMGQGGASAAEPVGLYQLAGGPDAAAEIVLRTDGSFEYFLAAGSLDEHAKGLWKADGRALHLTTLPKPVAAVFAAGAISASRDAPLILHVVDPNGSGIAAVDLRVGFDGGEEAEGYTQDYGWSLSPEDTRVPRWVEFELPIYQLRSQRFSVDLSKGNELSFVLTPNDLGVIDFANVRIDIEPGQLTMHRGAGVLTFKKRAPSD